MATLKYFAWIDDPDSADVSLPAGELPPFDFASLASKSAAARWVQRFLLRRVLPALTFLLRWLWPNPKFGRIVIVTRREDAKAVLHDKKCFRVVYTPEMRLLGGGADNVLAVDGTAHDGLREELIAALPYTDLPRVEVWSEQLAAQLIGVGGGRIDVMRDLITRTASEVTARHLGLTLHDPDAFAEWTMAVSAMLFGDYFGDTNVRQQATTASAHLIGVIDDAIARVHANDADHRHSRRERVTVVDRLVKSGVLTDAEIRAALIGLATAFVPTNTLAGGNMLEELLSRPAMFGAARRAAIAGDKAALRDILLEAGRRNPALSPGLWRHLPGDAAPTAIGRRKVAPGDAVLVCIPSALRDRRRGNADADDESDARSHAWMMFGYGPHDCLGASLALAHLTEVFAVLLAQPGLAPARGKHGRMLRTGPYPTRMDMVYDAPLAQRAQILAALPVRDGTPLHEVQAAAAQIGNPVNPALRARLDASNVILFTSLTVIEAAPGSTKAIVLVEINADGSRASAIKAYCEAAFDDLAPLLRHCTPNGQPPVDAVALAALLDKAAFELDRKPWGNTGLHFDGLPELAVGDIDRQARLADYARRTIDYHAERDFGRSSRAMDALMRVRRMIRQDSFYALRGRRDRTWGEIFNEGAAFEYALIRPSRRRLGIADWTPPKSIFTPIVPMLLSRSGRPIVLTMALAWLGCGLSLGWWLAPDAQGNGFDWTWTVVVAFVGSGILTLLAAATVLGLFLLLLRRHERRDHSDTEIADIAHVRAIAARENAPGHAQNHIVALMPFKPGAFRKLSFAFAMWGIKQAVSFWFRPGFVVTMGTIHKARWFRVPGTRQFVFFSNYDGSWESYLEDFITRAHEGQTAAWSHGIGFPPSRYLILDGADNGDRFKRWVRRQQRVTAVWYSRFPALTAQQIRANAMIEDGLARAASDTDARRWLAHFGSAQREAHELESAEAQSIVFTGFGKQQEATALAVRLPDDPGACRIWLQRISGLEIRPASRKQMMLIKLLASSKSGENAKPDRLGTAEAIRFGDVAISGGGAAIGFTEAGLRRAGLDAASGIEQFPAAFRMAMAGRTRILGDAGPSGARDAARDWRFSDAPDAENGVDALLIIYGSGEGSSHAGLVEQHCRELGQLGGAIVYAVPCSPVCDEDGHPHPEREHFGWRDGISQPVIAGTRRMQARVPARDMVEPGEFLLGYPNGQGFIAPPIAVGAHLDPFSILPTVAAGKGNRYPFFGNRDGNPDLRDFGRNGSFLAVRQLDQNVEAFQEQLESAAGKLNLGYRQLGALQGTAIDANWLGAKIIGRWPDGSPLVGNPAVPAGLGVGDVPDNDFAYGVDDPRGFACPLGSHIRRTNPRDSQEPGDLDEHQITTRHRLLRRGRSYAYRADGADAPLVKGLLFMALCSDIERQFEFVQHSWINASSFHGLAYEADPLLGNPQAAGGAFLPPFGFALSSKRGDASKAGGAPKTIFSIPTETGAVRVRGLESYVTMRGGGYFFVPSRSALLFLIDRLGRRLPE